MPRKKNIALISRADARGGGASRVADDIATLLGKDAQWTPRRYIGEFSPASRDTHKPIENRARSFARIVRTGLKRVGYVDHFPVELPFLNGGILSADVIHAHDITTVMAPATLQILARARALAGRRVIWTLHDMSAITGGCIYPIGCGGWRDGCGGCPMLDQWPFGSKIDHTAAMQRKRLQILRQGNIELVSPSRWLARHVEAAVPEARVRVIPNGVDTNTFAPEGSADESQHREPSTPRLLFIANHIRDMRKGGTYISNIRRHVNAIGRDLELVVVGSGNDGAIVRQGHLTIRYLGRFDDKAGLAQAYRSTEALLLPTHADNFPLVMTEAMACALPVFAFDTGGIAEAIDESCGSVRPAGHIDALIDDFLAARDAGAMPRLARQARLRVEERYTMEAFAQAHRDLYASAARDER